MNRSKKCLVGGLMCLSVLYISGCPGAVQFPATFTLGDALGTFEVTAGEPEQNAGTGDLGDSGFEIGSGSMRINPDDVTFTPADNGSGKGTVAFQAGGGSFTVVGGIAAAADVATVCDAPVDEYGPFTVVLDADFNVESITPDSITLEQTTIDLLNAGEFSICLTVESDVDGTVEIDALSFVLGL